MFNEKLTKFLYQALEGSESSVELIKLLKTIALNLYDKGILSASDHCDIEAFLDYKLNELGK